MFSILTVYKLLFTYMRNLTILTISHSTLTYIAIEDLMWYIKPKGKPVGMVGVW